MKKVPLTENEAQAIMTSALAGIDDGHGVAVHIREIARMDPQLRNGEILSYVASHSATFLTRHHTALIALLSVDATDVHACSYAERSAMKLAPRHIDMLIDILERPNASYSSRGTGPFAAVFARAKKSSLTREHHERLLGVIIREGESMDALAYARQNKEAMDEGLHALVIGLFRRDTCNGARCAAEYAGYEAFTAGHYWILIATIADSIRTREIPYHMGLLIRNAPPLDPDQTDRILDVLANRLEIHPKALIGYAKDCKALTHDHARRVVRYAQERGVTVTEEELGQPAFDADDVVV